MNAKKITKTILFGLCSLLQVFPILAITAFRAMGQGADVGYTWMQFSEKTNLQPAMVISLILSIVALLLMAGRTLLYVFNKKIAIKPITVLFVISTIAGLITFLVGSGVPEAYVGLMDPTPATFYLISVILSWILLPIASKLKDEQKRRKENNPRLLPIVNT